MSLISYSEGFLVADRNCEDREAGLTTAFGEMKKLHLSKCGSVALAYNGAYRSKARIDFLISLLVAKLRMHQIETEDSVLVPTISLGEGAGFFGEDGSWIVMTKENAYMLEDQYLVELAPEQTFCSGTMRGPFLLLRNSGIPPTKALEMTISVSPCSSRTIDVIEQNSLADLHIDAELFSAMAVAVKGGSHQ